MIWCMNEVQNVFIFINKPKSQKTAVSYRELKIKHMYNELKIKHFRV